MYNCNHIPNKNLYISKLFSRIPLIQGRKKVPTRAPVGPHTAFAGPPRGPLLEPVGAPWGPLKFGGPVTLSRVLPPVGGPATTAETTDPIKNDRSR